MYRSRRTVALLVVCAILTIATVAWARPAFLGTFMGTYKVNKMSALGKASCGICHLSRTRTDKLNPYGMDLQKAMRAAKSAVLTKAILTKVEKLDSDKDKFKNIAEIKAGTLPGDPKSHK